MGNELRRGNKKSCGCLKMKSYAEPKKCEYCGAPVERSHRFCSRACSAKARCNVKLVEVDEDQDWKDAGGGLYRCPHQRFVRCKDRDCDYCGWNPEVAKARLEAIMEQRKKVTE